MVSTYFVADTIFTPISASVQDGIGRTLTLLWSIKKNARLPCDKRLADGSYLSRIYPSEKDRTRQRHAICLRVIEYRLEGVNDAEPIYRLVTSVLNPQQGPAAELAALHHERWESKPR